MEIVSNEARFWIDSIIGPEMRRTATPERWVHLEQARFSFSSLSAANCPDQPSQLSGLSRSGGIIICHDNTYVYCAILRGAGEEQNRDGRTFARVNVRMCYAFRSRSVVKNRPVCRARAAAGRKTAPADAPQQRMRAKCSTCRVKKE